MTKSLFFTAISAAATFAAAFALGAAITTILGPGTSGLVTVIVTTILMVVGARIVDRPWFFTVAVCLFALFAIPTNLFGPPGPHKLLVGLATGLVYDIVWRISGKRWFSLPLAAAIATGVSIVLILLLLVWTNHPRKDFLAGIVLYLVPVYAVLGFIGGILGNRLYDRRLSKMSIVQQAKDSDA